MVFYPRCLGLGLPKSEASSENSVEAKDESRVILGDDLKRYIYIIHPIGSMHGIYTYIYHKNQLHVGKYIQVVGKYIPVPWILWV